MTDNIVIKTDPRAPGFKTTRIYLSDDLFTKAMQVGLRRKPRQGSLFI